VRPVDKGEDVVGLAKHENAKPELVARLGEFCCYCESYGSPQQLHVEHIRSQKAHPLLVALWANLTLACTTCNTYKRHYLGDGRQSGMLKRFLWAHLDNTFNAFSYEANGHVLPRTTLSADLINLAQATCDMIGLMKSPAVAAGYQDLGIAYDGVKKRQEIWGIAQTAVEAYQENPSPKQIKSIADACYKTGHFSIWMEVFRRHQDVRLALIERCKGAKACFDANSLPIARGRM
jgi:uncharacterized protein (TIGR02646 family)